MSDPKPISLTRLIAIPAVITLAVTILRLVGELQHWPTLWFSTAAGGGAAVVGIWWLPIIFGRYFAWKLTDAGEGAGSMGKAIGFAFVSLLVFVLAGIWFGATESPPSYLTLVPLLLMLAAAFVPGIGWRPLGNALLAYAFAARIPVVAVMYYAMHGNGGAGWRTHYDAVPSSMAHTSLTLKFLYAAIAP